MIHFIIDDDRNIKKPAHSCGFTRLVNGNTRLQPLPKWYCGLCGLLDDEEQEIMNQWISELQNGQDYGK